MTLLASGLSLSASATQPPACAPALATYARVAGDPAGLRAHLAPYYEIGLEGQVFGPGPGTAVPWPDVAAWTAARPASGISYCRTDRGWTFAALSVPGGHAYVLLTPASAVSKLYLSTEPLPWD